MCVCDGGAAAREMDFKSFARGVAVSLENTEFKTEYRVCKDNSRTISKSHSKDKITIPKGVEVIITIWFLFYKTFRNSTNKYLQVPIQIGNQKHNPPSGQSGKNKPVDGGRRRINTSGRTI